MDGAFAAVSSSQKAGAPPIFAVCSFLFVLISSVIALDARLDSDRESLVALHNGYFPVFLTET